MGYRQAFNNTDWWETKPCPGCGQDLLYCPSPKDRSNPTPEETKRMSDYATAALLGGAARFCWNCGNGFKIMCKSCGSRTPYGVPFCGQCGAKMPTHSTGLSKEKIEYWRQWFQSIGWIEQFRHESEWWFERDVGHLLPDAEKKGFIPVITRDEPYVIKVRLSGNEDWKPFGIRLNGVETKGAVILTSRRLFYKIVSAGWWFADMNEVRTEGDVLTFVTKDEQKLDVLLRMGKPKGLFGMGMNPKNFMGKIAEFAHDVNEIAHAKQ